MKDYFFLKSVLTLTSVKQETALNVTEECSVKQTYVNYTAGKVTRSGKCLAFVNDRTNIETCSISIVPVSSCILALAMTNICELGWNAKMKTM
jgi:hypothetical protein